MILPKDLLKRYWRHSSFRNLQEEIIEAVISKKDVFALLPTGAGKSLCYQIPALAKEGICLVISPLISLMKDQIEQLERKGIKALTIESNTSVDQIVTLFDNLKFGKYKFLYLSPERLNSEFILNKIKQMPLFRMGGVRGGLIIEKKNSRDYPLNKIAERTIGYAVSYTHLTLPTSDLV